MAFEIYNQRHVIVNAFDLQISVLTLQLVMFYVWCIHVMPIFYM